jgi:hypothetical protein
VYSYEKVSIKKEPSKGENERMRHPYHKPRLEQLGDLRTLTLGQTPPTPFMDSNPTNGPYARV